MDSELRTYLEGMESRLDQKFERRLSTALEGMESRLDQKFERRLSTALEGMERRFDEKLDTLENRLIERMRDMQTELLRGFESFSASQTIRLRKLEADQSNLDVSLRGRVDVLETRLTQIELRLGKQM